MSLSVCLLTRNEEHNIERVLRSVAGIADEVIVADTGSTDRTAALAAQLGAKVSDFDWKDDFAEGRNFALARATGDWILWLNPDEELLPQSRKVLPRCLAMDSAVGFIVRVEDQLKADRPDSTVATNQPRLFRRSAGARFIGRLHPYFDPPLDEVGRRMGKLVLATSELILKRHAYLSTLTPEKLRWAKHLLELELRDRPGQLHYLIEYGRTLLLLNDPHGHEVLAQATEQMLQSRDAPKPAITTVGSLLEYLLNVSPEDSRSTISRADALELALRWFPKTPPVVWAAAQRLFADGRFAEAAPLLERLLEMGRSESYEHADAFDPEIVGASALMNLGCCLVQLGELEKARHCFGQLLANPTHQAKARQNYGLVEAILRKRDK
jgi:tetratricopeptide (TPR) repeat protein